MEYMTFSYEDAERKMAEYRVPEHLRGGLWRYLTKGIAPGSFLAAVLKNDLREAVMRGDSDSLAGLPNIVKFIYNEAPSEAWGSEER